MSDFVVKNQLVRIEKRGANQWPTAAITLARSGRASETVPLALVSWMTPWFSIAPRNPGRRF